MAGGAGVAFAAFLAAAAVLVLLLFAASVGTALARERAVAWGRAQAAPFRRWGGWVAIIVGLWLITLAVWADTFVRILAR